MKYQIFRKISLLLVVSVLIGIMLKGKAFAETNTSDFYEVTFALDGHATVDVYNTQDYTTPDGSNVQSAFARSSASPVETQEKEKDVTAESNAKNVVINEVESNGDTTDWAEIYNVGDTAVDISGWYITDDDTNRLSKGKTTQVPNGTVLGAGEYFVFDQYVNFDFGLGAPDEVNLFDKNGNLITKYSYSSHASGVYARIPNGTGAFADVSISTKGSENKAEETGKPSYPNAIAWPGSDQVDTIDNGTPIFKADSSGLDFYNGKLYCINNKQGTFWVYDVAKDGSMSLANGFTVAGKNLSFLADAANPEASNPDTEGITIDGNGMAYAAAERDNNNKNVNYDVILQFDPWEEGSTVVAAKEWNITNKLPDVPANAGIEAVEWVSFSELEGKLFDESKGYAFKTSDYPDAYGNGIFFVALENNGHIYAFIFKADGSSELIAEIDPQIGGAMGLDYDTYTHTLWVGADDGYLNISAQVVFNGTSTPDVTLVNPAAGIDISRNNEGFAIATADYTVNGLRPVYHFMDGVDSGVLTVSYLNTDYTAPIEAKEESKVSETKSSAVTEATNSSNEVQEATTEVRVSSEEKTTVKKKVTSATVSNTVPVEVEAVSQEASEEETVIKNTEDIAADNEQQKEVNVENLQIDDSDVTPLAAANDDKSSPESNSSFSVVFLTIVLLIIIAAAGFFIVRNKKIKND